MRILNTKNKSQKLFGICCLAFVIFSGCMQKSDLDLARESAAASDLYHQRAVERYKKMILRGVDLDRLYLELGQVYYSHGEFQQAQEELRKSSSPAARKLLAISLYSLGNFTDAMEIFDKNNIKDNEYLYYYGLACEKLNLFDKAQEVYRKITGGAFQERSRQRIDLIQKQASPENIRNIDPKVAKIIAGAPVAQNYPQAGALVLSCDEKIEVSSEGTQVSSLHYLVKISNERGKREYSETSIDYDSTFEKVELEFARTIKPDGSVAEVGSRHIRDVSRYLNFPLYSNARVYIISFPEIAEGSCLEYKLKIHRSQLVNKKDFVLDYPLQAAEPIIKADFSVTSPRPVHIKVLNEKFNDSGANLKPTIEEKGDVVIYRWSFKDIPAIIPESNMPPEVCVNPTILISTFNHWQEVHDWWWSLAKDRMAADSAIKDKVRELTRNKKGDEDKIRAIYNFCAEKIRYVAVEYGQAGHQPHYAYDIFRNKYGDCKDQAVLLVTMLKVAGFNAWPVLIPTKEDYDINDDLPAIFFNHCIAAVWFKEGLVFMDPTAQTCSFGDLPAGDQERKVLVFKEDECLIAQTPLFPAGNNSMRQDLEIGISPDESLRAKKLNYTYGIFDQAQRYWLLYTQPELIQEMLKEKIQEVSIGSRLIKYDIQNLSDLNKPLVLSYDFQGPEYFTVAGELRILPQLSSFDPGLAAKDGRKYAIDFGVLERREANFVIEIPDSFVVKYMPASISEDSLWLKFSAQYRSQGNKIFFRQVYELKKNTIPQDEYREFKKFYEGLAQKVKQRIVLERTG
ncbi:MAG: DUF3857 domain-containing protein [Candidatus Omnitrophica bacterium]|nr:DUF3857 domain-containing protein [Candidatus Omnitrophota bacterium]